MRKPVLKIVSVNPVNSSVPIETIIQSKMTKALTRPVRFIYREGIVVKIEYIKNEPKWSLDIKKGVVSLLHLDVLSYKPETTNNTVYNKTEVFDLVSTTSCPVSFYPSTETSSQDFLFSYPMTAAVEWSVFLAMAW